ncbi:23S rRNA (cytidine1920-2'-O)/16S rRNA (cytidine1409-2'-O)-methyltransferase [Breznakia sp. PF5-3]|uniref:TlyA family RNA methyltransferase n=1 Tax=unclassified Breznakia TaxID=2623764 RepID=UPI00240650C0|nr:MULTISPECIES: TlyA family RNA methyltransferase [unclassified Breznakia]MDL2276474.1 TlyA family RNA methyltransferase [Breznakia sp. OttesenSCG-928-G09]MDF9823913.1 23S rRNA (cytidine1920-2'-O)/16S rRNA (cytidine1409-2'-O)-methyltransferase [Breznakia sp. PM6-1]MDF9834712.1 23S rRNA (cytidine1920-2'-O)/16S rRNA (cytidine1409-2'-O)-methyltransferase [Breznakia sp. PF5-3]MDF9836853.1 23S rRNA (cytidine1920-2'-O)/16S rRNA (cytidine1409-2'-O)-methyltransferase [Breznakia sp. PFB2-8]MDF9858870.
MRLDVYLITNEFLNTRSQAQDYIKDGYVLVNGKIISKPSYQVQDGDHVEVQKKKYDFASRAGLKLFDALVAFDISLQDKVVLDIGASTGGFSDVCLRQGAKYIYAVDVGHDQLVPHLRNDSRVKNLEGVNARYLDKNMFEEKIDFVCIDVSFISVNLILPQLLSILETPYQLMVLIKPQFEVGKEYLNKQGVVRDKRIHKRLLNDYIAIFKNYRLGIRGIKKASIQGRTGNQEYLVYLDSELHSKDFDITRIISE